MLHLRAADRSLEVGHPVLEADAVVDEARLGGIPKAKILEGAQPRGDLAVVGHHHSPSPVVMFLLA